MRAAYSAEDEMRAGTRFTVSLFNWFSFSLCLGSLFALLGVVFVCLFSPLQDHLREDI